MLAEEMTPMLVTITGAEETTMEAPKKIMQIAMPCTLSNIRLRAHANRKQRHRAAREQDNGPEGQPHAVRYPAYRLQEEAKRKKKDAGERGSRLVADAVGDLANHLTVCLSMLCHSVRTKHGQKQRAHMHTWVGAASGRVRSAGTLIFSSRA